MTPLEIYADARDRFERRYTWAQLALAAPDIRAKLDEVANLFEDEQPTLEVAQSFARGIDVALAALKAYPLDALIAIRCRGLTLILVKPDDPIDNLPPGAVPVTAEALGSLLEALPEADWKTIAEAARLWPGASVAHRSGT